MFRLEIGNTGFVRLSSMNFSRKIYPDTLVQKFLLLENSCNLKTGFQKKLENKIENHDHKFGDFGLDFCFKYSVYRQFRRGKHIDNEQIVFLSFSFPCYE